MATLHKFLTIARKVRNSQSLLIEAIQVDGMYK